MKLYTPRRLLGRYTNSVYHALCEAEKTGQSACGVPALETSRRRWDLSHIGSRVSCPDCLRKLKAEEPKQLPLIKRPEVRT